MKRILFIFIFGMMGRVAAQDTIHLAPAPAHWPVFEAGSWEVQVGNFLSRSQTFFAQDPNYYMSEYAMDYELLRDPLADMLSARPAAQQLYEWALPALKEKWAKMTHYERANIYMALKHAKQYMASFSVEAEDRYWNILRNRRYILAHDVNSTSKSWNVYGEGVFTRKRPIDFYDSLFKEPYPTNFPYRRIETFVYRRVKDGIPLGNMQYLVDRMLQDFPLPQNGRFEVKHPDGQLKEKGEYKDGLPHGNWQVFLGTVNDSGYYDMGVKEGTWASKNDRFGSEYIDYSTYKKGFMVRNKSVSYYNGKLAWLRELDSEKRKYIYERHYSGTPEREEEDLYFTWVPIVAEDNEGDDDANKKFLSTLYVNGEDEYTVKIFTNLEGGKVYIFELDCELPITTALFNSKGEEVAVGDNRLRFDVRQTGEYKLVVTNEDQETFNCPMHQYFILKE